MTNPDDGQVRLFRSHRPKQGREQLRIFCTWKDAVDVVYEFIDAAELRRIVQPGLWESADLNDWSRLFLPLWGKRRGLNISHAGDAPVKYRSYEARYELRNKIKTAKTVLSLNGVKDMSKLSQPGRPLSMKRIAE